MSTRTDPTILDEQRDGDECTLHLHIPDDLAYFPGHFPQAPVLPGVVQIAWALQLAASRLGTLPQCRELEALKFQRLLRPGDRVALALRHDRARGKLHFAYRQGDVAYSSGRLVPFPPSERKAGDPLPLPMQRASPWPIAALLPHAGEMLLLDAVLEHGPAHVLCNRRVPVHGLLHDTGGALPAWTGVELMAQAIAAWAGCQAREAGEPVRLGFLLGTRRYVCNVTAFAPGSELRIEARRDFHDGNGMGLFACRIEAPGMWAQAQLAVFSPPDASALFPSDAKEPEHG